MGFHAPAALSLLLIDNYDSFTYNLFQLLAACGAMVTVVQHDRIRLPEIAALQPDGIVLSPGPGRPERRNICMQVIKRFFKHLPILGVCLGHQYLGAVFGSPVVHAHHILHGKTSAIYHTGGGIFERLPNPFSAARYHSLVLDRVPQGFLLSAWSDDGEVMGIMHRHYPVFGIQFHPESFMTEAGVLLVRNFLYVCRHAAA